MAAAACACHARLVPVELELGAEAGAACPIAGRCAPAPWEGAQEESPRVLSMRIQPVGEPTDVGLTRYLSPDLSVTCTEVPVGI